MRRFLFYYHPKLPIYLAYMLQQVEYNPNKFLAWILRLPDLSKVIHRQSLVRTRKADALVAIIGLTGVFYIFATMLFLYINPIVGLVVGLLSPAMVILETYLVVLFGWLYYEEPRRSKVLKQGAKSFKEHPGIKIAVAGSYGKTTIKEILNTVLSQNKKVAATPGNRNVPVSHAAWIKKLDGDEDILLLEYGEGAPGDIAKLAKLTHPDYGILTGLAPNHLDEYKTLNNVAADLLSLSEFVHEEKLYINEKAFAGFEVGDAVTFSESGVKGWRVDKVRVDYEGLKFDLIKGKIAIRVRSGLLGRHLVAPLALAAVLAHELGLSVEKIEAGLAATKPYEHRMQPRQIAGAWVIDDTYNGSLEGFRAGLALLSELPAKRKIYVTPGLVDQGEETERVHLEIGRLIAKANPDRVVLMQNSVTQFILKGLEEAEFKGDLQIESDPLAFYTNIEHVVAAGDLVVMQNDWTDNYA